MTPACDQFLTEEFFEFKVADAALDSATYLARKATDRLEAKFITLSDVEQRYCLGQINFMMGSGMRAKETLARLKRASKRAKKSKSAAK